MARPPHRNKPKPAGRPLLTLRGAREDLHKIAGLPAVQALYAHAPDRAERLFFDDRMRDQAAPYAKLMAARRKVYRHVPTEELTRIAGTPLHGGIVVVAQPKPIDTFDPVQAVLWAKAGQPLLVLDGVGNPHNLGAIARTMAFFGLEWVTVHRATDLPATLNALKPHYRVIGTALGALRPLAEVMAPGANPLAIVLGNEEDGLPEATRAACDEVATLPGAGRVQSLNVSATAAILVHLLAGSHG